MSQLWRRHTLGRRIRAPAQTHHGEMGDDGSARSEKNATTYRLRELPGIRAKSVRTLVVHSSAMEAKAAH